MPPFCNAKPTLIAPPKLNGGKKAGETPKEANDAIFEAAYQALEAVTKDHVRELKCLSNPPPNLVEVLAVVACYTSLHVNPAF